MPCGTSGGLAGAERGGKVGGGGEGRGCMPWASRNLHKAGHKNYKLIIIKKLAILL
jgi:hypothetical protein